MKKYLQCSFVIIFSILFFPILSAQTTYTWNVSSGDWGTSTSWNPSRSSPSPNDILIFNGSTIASPTVTNIPKDSIGKLRLINNAQVNFSSAVATAGVGTISRSGTTITGSSTQFLNQLMVGDGFYHGSGSGIAEVVSIASNVSMTGTVSSTATGLAWNIWPRISIMSTSAPAFEIQSGSSLTCSAANPKSIVIFMGSGSKALISGTIFLTNGRHKFTSNDSNAIVFKNGGTLNITDGYNGIPFGTVGNTNVVTFDSGSTYITNSTTTPFGLAAPASRVYFAHGSNYIHKNPTYNFDMFDGRNYDKFTIDTIDFNESTIDIPLGCTIDTLIISNATNIGFDGTSSGILNILGGLIINNGNFIIGQGTSAKEIRFSGSGISNSISGSGNISIGSNATFTVNNSAGLKLYKNIIVGGTLNMTQGNIFLLNDTLTLGYISSHIGILNYTAGNIIGPGVFKRWFGTTAITIGTNAGRFPMGTISADRSLWVSGTPSAAGTISVSHNDVNSSSTFSTPFSDNATNAVSVNVRQNKSWAVSTANGFAGSSFGIRVQSSAATSEVTNTTNLRLTLGTGIAPGTAADGGGTNSLPQANRTAITAANLNNTFYIGGNTSQNPLPVKLANLTVSNLNEKNVLIEWKSFSEINTDRYEIEKSIDGILFEKFASVKSSGNSTSIINYEAKDIDAFKNNTIIYYRLKTIDIDGSYENSTIVSIKKGISNTFNINNVSPNPTSSDINLNISSIHNQHAKIEVIDIAGSIVYSTEKMLNNGENSFTINTDLIPKGIYFIRVISLNDVKHLKILKN